jgi:acetolactate synthase-1/2/3 large subunit
MTYRVADLVADSLLAHGVDRGFSVPGESFLPLLDALHDRQSFDLVTCRHEGSAALAACADARLTRRPGVVMCSRGPGLSNAVIGLHVASQEALPLVLLMGQVDLPNLGRDAVQEVDARLNLRGMSKWSARITHPEQASEIMARGFSTAMSGTPGPVIIELPEDLLAAACQRHPPAVHRVAQPVASPEAVAEAVSLIGHAERPLLIVGGETVTPAFKRDLLDFSMRAAVPVLATSKHQDLFPNSHPHWVGQLGIFPAAAHAALCARADLIVALGTRLGDVSSLGFTVPRQRPEPQTLIHVYPDPDAMGRHFLAQLPIVSTAGAFLSRIGDAEIARPDRAAWLQDAAAARTQAHGWSPAKIPDADIFGKVIDAVSGRLAPDAIITADSGNFIGWVQRSLTLGVEHRLVSSACGAMGISVPGALAAALRFPERQILAFCGDGGFLMNGNELATAVGRDLNLKVFVLNNGTYGTIRGFQERAFPGRPSGTTLFNPDFRRLADAFGARGFRVEQASQANAVVNAALDFRGPALLEVVCDPSYAIADSLAVMGTLSSS